MKVALESRAGLKSLKTFWYGVALLLVVLIALSRASICAEDHIPWLSHLLMSTLTLYSCEMQDIKEYKHTRTAKEREALEGLVEVIYDPIRGENAFIK